MTNTSHNFTVKSEMTKDYGIIKKTYAYATTFSGDDKESFWQGVHHCDTMVDEMFRDFEVEQLPQLAATFKPPEMVNQEGEVWQTGLKLVKTVTRGKEYFAIITPRYQKFGVAMWKECIGYQMMIDLLGAHYEHDLDGCSVRIDTTGKYPKAVEVVLEDIPF